MKVRLVHGAWGRSVVALLLLGSVALGNVRRSEAGDPADSQGEARPGTLVLEETPEPLAPQRARTSAEEDRLEALARFAAGRSLEQHGKYRDALRCYQRAMRCDPPALSVARAILRLTDHLGRQAETLRYGLKAVELGERDRVLLEWLGASLIKAGDLKAAMRMYELAVAAGQDGKEATEDIELRMDLGRLYYALEEPAKAADCLARVARALGRADEIRLDGRAKTRLLGEGGASYRLFGEVFLQAGRVDEAMAAFERANEIAPVAGWLEYQRARVHAHQGKADQALADLEACFRAGLSGEGSRPYELLAELLEKTGKKGELVSRLESLRSADPENAPLGYALARQNLEAGQFDQAEKLYVGLLEKKASPAGYRGLVEIYRKSRREDRLLDVLGQMVTKVGNLETLGSELKAIVDDEELVRLLLKAARKRVEEDPKKVDCGTCYAAALLAMEKKQFDVAGELFDAALATQPKQAAELLLVWGVGLMLEERGAEAVKVFQRAIAHHALPADNPMFYFYLSGALAMEKRTDEALNAARRAAEIDPESARYASRVAWILYRGERHEEAAESYRALLEEFGDQYESDETRDVLREARLALSNLCVHQGDLAGAVECLEQVLDEYPEDAGAANDLGYLWADEGKHLVRAERMIRQAVAAEPENLAYRDSLGWVLYRQDRLDEAVVELEKAASGSQPDAVILDHLGDVYQKAQRREKAEQAWRRAAEAFQKQGEGDKVKQMEKKIRAAAKAEG